MYALAIVGIIALIVAGVIGVGVILRALFNMLFDGWL